MEQDPKALGRTTHGNERVSASLPFDVEKRRNKEGIRGEVASETSLGLQRFTSEVDESKAAVG